MNKKGFMLAEVIIASVVLIATMVALYSGFNRLYNNYTELSKYYSVDALYASKTMEDYLIDEFKLDDLVSDTGSLSTSPYYITLISDKICETSIFQSSGTLSYQNVFCTQIVSQYSIKSMYLINYANISSISITGANQTLKDYFDYLENSLVNNPKYLIITEIEDSNKNIYYSNLKVE